MNKKSFRIGTNAEPSEEEINEVLKSANEKVMKKTKELRDAIEKNFKSIYG